MSYASTCLTDAHIIAQGFLVYKAIQNILMNFIKNLKFLFLLDVSFVQKYKMPVMHESSLCHPQKHLHCFTAVLKILQNS